MLSLCDNAFIVAQCVLTGKGFPIWCTGNTDDKLMGRVAVNPMNNSPRSGDTSGLHTGGSGDIGIVDDDLWVPPGRTR